MKLIYYIPFIFFGLLITSYRKDFFESEVEIALPTHIPELVVAANLSNLDEVSALHLTSTVGIFESQDAQPITDAQVALYEDGQLLQTYNHKVYEDDVNKDNLYVVENPQALTVGKTYELRISAPNYESVTATQVLKNTTPIISAVYEENTVVYSAEDGIQGRELSIKFKDTPNEKNYYAISARFKESDNTNSAGKLQGFLFPLGPIVEEGTTTLLLSDATFNGKEYDLKMGLFNNFENVEEIEIILYTITEDRYLYEKSLTSYNSGSNNPFAEPVVIHGNVIQGKGIFTMSAGSTFTVKL